MVHGTHLKFRVRVHAVEEHEPDWLCSSAGTSPRMGGVCSTSLNAPLGVTTHGRDTRAARNKKKMLLPIKFFSRNHCSLKSFISGDSIAIQEEESTNLGFSLCTPIHLLLSSGKQPRQCIAVSKAQPCINSATLACAGAGQGNARTSLRSQQ